MAIPKEQRIIELLTKSMIKADKMDEKFDRQQKVLEKQQDFLLEQSKRMEVMLGVPIKHFEKYRKN